MTRLFRTLAIGFILIGTQLCWGRISGQGQTAPPQGRGAGAARQAQPRARSVTLGDLTNFEGKDNVVQISAGADQIRILYYRDDIFRIWLGPDGNFSDAQAPEDAQMLVYRGAPIAVSWRDAGDYYRIESKECVLRVNKRPLRFALFDKDNAAVVWQETRPLTYGPSTVQTGRRGEAENFYGGGMQEG